MVKRLHLGRAAESGVLAASLAKNGFSGPATVLEGKFGYMNVFCRDGDASRMTAALGESWKLLTLTVKRYAAHVTAHVPVTASGHADVTKPLLSASAGLQALWGKDAANTASVTFQQPFRIAMHASRLIARSGA